jgi:hypothetical protein
VRGDEHDRAPGSANEAHRHRAEEPAAQRPATASAGHGEARSLLPGGSGERLGRIAVLDVHRHEAALESRGQRLGVADGARAVLGAIVADQHGPRLAHRGVRRDDHDGARRVGRERP